MVSSRSLAASSPSFSLSVDLTLRAGLVATLDKSTPNRAWMRVKEE